MYIDTEKIERRCLKAAEFRVEENESKIVGYAALFNVWTEIGGMFRESIRPGAFAKSIRENDIRALWNHDPNYVLARNRSKSLRLREDANGLSVEIDPVPATWANDLLASMRRGDVSQMSFGFQVNKQSIDYEKDERVLEDVTLYDVSVVTYPAYPQTTASVRSMFQAAHEAKAAAAQKDPWAEFDSLIAKIKNGIELTEEEKRTLTACLPTLSVPPAQHTEMTPEPPAKHSDGKTRAKDAWKEFELKHGIF